MTKLVFALAVALLLAACGGAAQPAASTPASSGPAKASNPPALQAIVDAAAKEGQLALVWGEATEGGSQGIAKLAEGFNKTYGLKAKVEFTPGPSMPEMNAKLIEELQAKKPATSDVTIGYAFHAANAIAANALEQVNWASWSPNIKDPAFTAGNGAVVAFETSVAGIGYNTQKIGGAAIPKSLQDLLKPEYRGKIASTPYAANFDYLAMDAIWGEQKTVEFLNQFTKQVSGLIRCDEIQRLISGEFDVFALSCSQSNIYRDKAKGAPLEFVIPSDAPVLIPLYAGVPKNSAHPNMAKLWINYLMSREGQDILFQYDQQDAQGVPGSKTAGLLSNLQSSGVKLINVDVPVVQAQDRKEYARRRALAQKILTQR